MYITIIHPLDLQAKKRPQPLILTVNFLKHSLYDTKKQKDYSFYSQHLSHRFLSYSATISKLSDPKRIKVRITYPS